MQPNALLLQQNFDSQKVSVTPTDLETQWTLAATKFELNIIDWSHWSGLEARGGHEEGIELLLGARIVLEPSLAITYAWRREATAVSCLVAIPRVSPQVRTRSTHASFCPKTQRHRAPESSGAEGRWAPHGTVVPGLCAASIGYVLCELSARRWRARIRSPIHFCFNKILAARFRINVWDWSTMSWTHESKPWTQSMRPWTYSMGFSVEK
jgi:hypothetical protein